MHQETGQRGYVSDLQKCKRLTADKDCEMYWIKFIIYKGMYRDYTGHDNGIKGTFPIRVR